jgi:hypothetical protein
MKKIIVFSCIITLAMGVAGTAAASSRYLTEFNAAYGTIAGTSYNCSVCHTNTPALNSYGTDFASSTIAGHTARVFDAAFGTRDSDGDAFSNLVEIRGGTFPGNSSSRPATTDTTAPTVSTFTVPATSSSLTVAIYAIGATDNVGVTGYLVNESSAKPATTAPGWSTTAPTGYTFASAGAKTLYAWAKDAANNVSASKNATVTITLTPTPPPPGPEPVPADEMGAWVGTWFSITMRNEGFFVTGVGLTNDRQSVKGYVNISGWNPSTNVLDATLYYLDPATGNPVSVPLPLNFISGSVNHFRVWAHVTAGDVIYGFSALIKGTTNGGVIVLGSLKTIGGYHARVSTDEGGWLRITGKVTAEANVPTSINVP